jgi:uncharacterized protein YlaN (UPF0358 family)
MFTIFENDIGSVDQRMFFYKKLLGFVSQLKNLNDNDLQEIYRNIQSGAALLLTRENQAQGLLLLSKVYCERLISVEDEYSKETAENQLKQVVMRTIKLCKMACQVQLTNCYLYNKVLDSLILFRTKGIEVFELDNIKMNIEIIRKSIIKLREKGESEVASQEEANPENNDPSKNIYLKRAKHMEANFNRILKYGKRLPDLANLDA